MGLGRRLGVILLAGFALVTAVSRAEPADPAAEDVLTGTLIGFVSDRSGVPQMGASVLLYNRYDRLVGRALTNDKGAFGFAALLPGVYSVRVALASFVPALKNNINIQPGMQSFLSIDLASVLSSIELIYAAPGSTKVMSDDWKWVLRTASATRPVLRIAPPIAGVPDAEHERSMSLFSNTRGVVKVSTGEEGSLAAAGAQADLGTAFALATSLFGANEIQLSGNFGYSSNAGVPTAGFRTSYSHEDPWGARPEVNLTMRQVSLPARVGIAALTGGEAPLLRTMSVSTLDKRQLRDNLVLEYGAALESVMFLDRMNYFSPFARLTHEMDNFGSLRAAYSSGMPPAELLTASDAPELDLQQNLTVLATFPRLSLFAGSPRVQRVQSFEIAWSRVFGNRTVSVGAFRDSLTNTAVMMAAPAGFYSQSDLMPDMSSSQSVFNLGQFDRLGFVASVSQQVGEDYAVSLAYGNDDVLKPGFTGLASNNPSELRQGIVTERRDWLAARFTGRSPWTGTRFSTGYKWIDSTALAPTHLYLTQTFQPDLGLNIAVRQPLPSLGVWSGRFEASAELRNLLAEGYVPISTPDGRIVYLIQNPRAVRGGLSFIF